MRLRHVDTGGYLHSHNKKYTRIAGGQQEVSIGLSSLDYNRIGTNPFIQACFSSILRILQVCGIKEKRPDNIWLAVEGVYLPVSESKGSSASA